MPSLPVRATIRSNTRRFGCQERAGRITLHQDSCILYRDIVTPSYYSVLSSAACSTLSQRSKEFSVTDQPSAPDAAQPAPAGEPGSIGSMEHIGSIDGVMSALAARHYIADRGLATAIYLALKRHKPLLLEGEPGVGKTEVARVLADMLGTRLIRLQCYEGIDQSTAVYEWNYPRQLLAIRMLDVRAGEAGARGEAGLRDIFGPEFLIRRPLLQAIDAANE